MDLPVVATAKRYFRLSDKKQEGDITALFADDVELYAPKFAIGHGLAEMMAAGRGNERFRSISHRIDEFDIVESGGRVFIEGTTEGETTSGRSWDGCTSVDGRFYTVLTFSDTGKITRVCTYVDPDLAGETADRYPMCQSP